MTNNFKHVSFKTETGETFWSLNTFPRENLEISSNNQASAWIHGEKPKSKQKNNNKFKNHKQLCKNRL